MADKLRTVKDYLSAKQQALQVLSGDAVDVFTEGYLFGGTLYNKNNIPYVAPVIANVRGVKSTSLSPRRLEDCEWVVPKVNTAGYYLYIGTGGNIFVDIQPPTEVTGYVGLYHPGRNARYIRDFYVNSAGRISNLDVSGSILTGYYGTGTYESPDEGDVALLIQDARIVTLQYLGGKWSVDVNKVAIGILIGMLIFPGISCRGLIHPDADTSDLTGDEIPTGNFRLIDCETAGFPDQNGDVPTTVYANALRTTDWAKFGNYSLYSTANYGEVEYASLLSLDESFGGSFWINNHTMSGSTNLYIMNFVYTIDYSNNYNLFLTVGDGSFTLRFTEKYLNSVIQDKTIEITCTTGIYHVACGCVFKENYVYLVVNDSIETAEIETLSISGVASVNKYVISAFNSANNKFYVDDIAFVIDDSCNPDLFVSHYLSGLPWNTTFSNADMIIKPAASGGKIQLSGPINCSEMPEIAGSPIVDSDTGYVKYADGTMLCYGTVTARACATSFAGAYYWDNNYTTDFPEEFSAAPNVVATGNNYGFLSVTSIAADGVSLRGCRNDSGASVGGQYIAIGRWGA